MIGRALVVTGLIWSVAVLPAGAQVVPTDPPPTDPPTTRPPTTRPPTTQPPTTEPPVTEAPTTAATAPPSTRPRTATTKVTTTTIGTTTSLTLLPPPSVRPQDPEAPPIGSEQSDHLSSVFVWLSILGFLTAIGLLVSQWFLTRPGRRGWTF